MKRILSFLGIITVLLVAGCDKLNPVVNNNNNNNNNGSGISGTISKDTIWNTTTNHITGDLTITGNVTWKKGIKVTVDDNATISVEGTGKLIIEEGVSITFGTGSYIQVGYGSSGTLIAQGSDSLPVIFTKTTGVQNWGYGSGGILIYDKTTASTVLNHCIIEYAQTGIFVQGVKPVITNCIIRHNKGYGINYTVSGSNIGSPKDSASFVHNVIDSNGTYPIQMTAEGITALPGETVFRGNGTNGNAQAIYIKDGDVSISGTWKKQSIPYIFANSCSIENATGVTITIQPGTVLKFDSDAYIEVGYGNTGTLIANGDSANPITFTKSDSATSEWGYKLGGILLYVKSTAQCSFNYCIIEYAKTGMLVQGVKPVITNCIIRHNKGYGIDYATYGANIGSPKDSASFVHNVIDSNGTYPIQMYAEGITGLSGETVFRGNGTNGNAQAIYIKDGDVAITGTWRKQSIPYIFANSCSIENATGVTITIMPGAVFKFNNGAYIQVGYGNAGTLIAAGDSANPITFTKSDIATSEWGYSLGGILLYPKASSLCSFNHCIIEYAQTGLYVQGVKPVINKCIIRHNKAFGIDFAVSGTNVGMPKDFTSFGYNVIDSNGTYPIQIYAEGIVGISSDTRFNGNGTNGDGQAIYVKGGDVTVSGTWRNPGVPYLFANPCSIENASGVTITIMPGTVLKFNTDAYIQVGHGNAGTLIAAGTATAIITFTQNIPGSSWGYSAGGLLFYPHTTSLTTLRYCDISFAKTGLYMDTQNPLTIANTAFDNNDKYGINFTSTANKTNVDLTTISFTNNGTADTLTNP